MENVIRDTQIAYLDIINKLLSIIEKYVEEENHAQCVCAETSSKNCPIHDKGE